MNIPDRFCKAGCHEAVYTVGELIEALEELPPELPIDRYENLPVVFNSQSDKPFFKLEDSDMFIDD